MVLSRSVNKGDLTLNKINFWKIDSRKFHPKIQDRNVKKYIPVPVIRTGIVFGKSSSRFWFLKPPSGRSLFMAAAKCLAATIHQFIRGNWMPDFYRGRTKINGDS